MRATAQVFWVVLALFLTQILLGAITAHYQVEGQEAYGFALSDILPYSITRTWHTQLAVLWIAVAWLGTGLYIAPAMSGHEPKFQRFGVNFLFACLLIIVVGAFAGQWLAVMQKLGLAHNFWFGHQGWEYADLGRFWQWFLFIGLGVWLTLVGRALWPCASAKGGESKSIVGLLFLSTVCIGLFFGAALMWGEHTHISEVEYWRWWLVHLWVEGFFEVFATAVMALLFTRLGLLRDASATTRCCSPRSCSCPAACSARCTTCTSSARRRRWSRWARASARWKWCRWPTSASRRTTPTSSGKATPWMPRYRWPILFFIAVSFWNLVGAGLFGFLINPPLSLYYMQGLNLTPLHGHTALFGVYGMLGIALMLFCLRGLQAEVVWNERAAEDVLLGVQHRPGLMALLTLLPLGMMQLRAAIEHGYWYARSAEFMQQPIIDMLVWMRVPGDTIFSVGALALAWFVFRLWVAPKREATARGGRCAAGQALTCF